MEQHPYTCQTCHGTGETPTGHATLYGGIAWTFCPDCDGEGVIYTCRQCMDTGVNVYDADFDPANPQPCQHCQPATQAA